MGIKFLTMVDFTGNAVKNMVLENLEDYPSTPAQGQVALVDGALYTYYGEAWVQSSLSSSGVITALGFTPVDAALIGADSGLATLDEDGKLTSDQIPAALVGGVQYQGSWNATTNSPTLVSSTGTKGQYYVVSTAGTTTIDGISQWNVGDWIIFNGTIWERIEDAGLVAVANGGTGATTVAGAKTNLGFITKFADDLGDGVNTVYSVEHSLNTLDVIVQVYEIATGGMVVPDVVLYDVDTVTLTFAVIPTSDQYRVVILG